MNCVIPTGLSETEWLLLLYLHKQGSFFYREQVFTHLFVYHISRLEYYHLLFSLTGGSYVVLEGEDKKIIGQQSDFRYALTLKGRQIIAECVQRKTVMPSNYLIISSVAHRVVRDETVTTVMLEDYLLGF